MATRPPRDGLEGPRKCSPDRVAAAWLATLAELLVPPLMALGLSVRPARLVLFAFNWVTAVSSPDLSDSRRRDPCYRGTLLLLLAGKAEDDLLSPH